VADALQKIDVLIIRLYKMDKALLEKSRRLKAVIKAGVGIDHIDLETATDLGIHVSISIGNHISVAEAAVALMLALSHNLTYLNRNTKPDMSKLGLELYGKKLGLIGFGRIGSHVAQIAEGLGMNIMVCDPYLRDTVKAPVKWHFVDLETILQESDILSIHCPLTPDTRHLLGEKQFETMKRSAFLVNTARGGIVDEAALCVALQKGLIAGAGVDVVEFEPLRDDNPLLKLDNVIVTPHRLIQTTDSLARQTRSIVESAREYSEGKIPDSSVNKNSILPMKDRMSAENFRMI
jgi:D-3-phosphoglycerate dehydrogenase